MSAGTVFFKPCKAGGVIAHRGAIYAKEVRDTTAFQWLYKKMAYATATAGGSALGINRGSGIGNTPGVGLYSKGASYNQGPRFIPKPHLVSVKTSYDGDFGTVIKCEIAFTVYTLDQLNSCEGFFTIGAACSANWGWANAGTAGSSESFTGQVVNFSWAINADGGADCSCTALGKGINVTSVNKNVRAASGGTAVAGPDEDVIPVTGVISLIANKVQAAKDLEVNSINADGIACIEYSEDWASEVKEQAVDPATEKPKEKPKEETATLPKQYYITLRQIVNYYAAAISAAWKIKPGPKLYMEHATAALDNITPATFASCNPTECLFPGYAKYGEKDFNVVGAGSIVGDNGLANILFNVDWMTKQYKDFSTAVDKGEKTSDQSIDGFFKILFACAEVNSGGLIKLTTAKRLNTINDIDIIDAAYCPPGVPITTIAAVSQNSVCRSMSLTAKIPSALATRAMVNSQSGGSDMSDGGKGTFPGIGVLLTSPNPVPKPAPFPGFGDGLKPIEFNDPVLGVFEIIGKSGTSIEIVTAAQEFLRANNGSQTNASTVIPLDFSFTIDGVGGMEFGDAVTTNYMPRIYKKVNCAFTVVSVEHSVSANDWTTTCSTVFRML